MNSARKKLFLIIMAITLAAAAGCAHKEVKYSGFLGDYSKFKPGPEGGVALVYIKQGADFSKWVFSKSSGRL